MEFITRPIVNLNQVHESKFAADSVSLASRSRCPMDPMPAPMIRSDIKLSKAFITASIVLFLDFVRWPVGRGPWLGSGIANRRASNSPIRLHSLTVINQTDFPRGQDEPEIAFRVPAVRLFRTQPMTGSRFGTGPGLLLGINSHDPFRDISSWTFSRVRSASARTRRTRPYRWCPATRPFLRIVWPSKAPALIVIGRSARASRRSHVLAPARGRRLLRRTNIRLSRRNGDETARGS